MIASKPNPPVSLMKTTQPTCRDVLFLNPNLPARARHVPWLATLVAAMILAVFAPGAHAAATATDDACQSAYSTTWATGNNGGTGWGGGWTMSLSGGNGGTYVGSSQNNAGGGGTGINTGCGNSWGIYANSSGTENAVRTFATANGSASLQPGQSFQIDMDSGYDNSSDSGGFDLQTSGPVTRLEFVHRSGQANYEVNDSAGFTSTGVGWTGGGLTVKVTLLTADTYTIAITPKGGSTTTLTGRTLAGTSGTGMSQVRIFRYNNESSPGGNGDYFFNSMSISCPSFSAGAPSSTTVCAGNTATFTTTATGASTPTYQWQVSVNGGTTWNNVSVGSGGTSASYSTNAVAAANNNKFRCIITDACGTSVTSAVATVTVDATTFTTSQNNVTCNGGSDGSITVTASGGSGTYTYSKDNGATYAANGGSFTGLAAGTYNIAVKDSNNCLSTTNAVTITQPAVVAVTEATGSHVNVTCNGNSTGTIVLNTATGGSGSGYQYSKDGGSTWQSGTSFSGLAAATYQMKAKDGNGCLSANVAVTITQPSAVTVTEATGSHVNVTCNGNSTGVIVLNTATGGSGSGYQYSKDGGSTWQSGTSFSGLAAATYQMKAKDGNGCVSANMAVTITQPSAVAVTEATGSHVNVTCNGNSTGVIVLNTATGGSGSGYQYSKDGGSTWQSGTTFSGLAAGTYQMAAKDGNGCTSGNVAVTITQPAVVAVTEASGSHVNATCNGTSTGTIVLNTATGGSGSGYQYSKDGGSTWQSGTTFSGLAAGTYQMAAKDGNGCTSGNVAVTITQPSAVTFTTSKTDNSVCGASGGSITVTASGGDGTYSYSDDNGTTWQSGNSFSSLAAGAYFIVVKDSNNCSSSATSVTISDPNGPSLSLTETDVTCTNGNDGTITATFSGNSPFQLQIDGGSFVTHTSGYQYTGLAAGSHAVVVKDASGCTTSESIGVSQPTAVSFTYGTTNITCNGGSDGSILFTNAGGSGAGYSVSIDDGVTFTATNLFTGLAAGSYSVVVKDGSGCLSATNSVTLTQPAAVTFTSSPNNLTCNGNSSGSFTITPSGGSGSGYTYSDDGGTTFQSGSTFSGLAAGGYSVVVKDGNGCLSSAATVTLTEPAVVTFTTSQTPTTCSGGSDGSITVTASGGSGSGYQYSKNGGSTWQSGNSFSGLAAGGYSIEVKDGNGCLSSAATVTITSPSAVTVTEATGSHVDLTCNGNTTGVIVLNTATGGSGSGYQYSKDGGSTWQSGTTFSGLAAGTYQMKAEDGNGCVSASVAVTITQPAAVTVTEATGSHVNATCNGNSTGVIVLNTATGGSGSGYQYSKDGGATWQSSTTFSGLAAGTYQMKAEDGNGCLSANVAVTITQPAAVTVTEATGSHVNETCNGNSTGVIVLNTATGGSGSGYQYSKDGGSTWQSSKTFSGLAAGTYQMAAKDGNSCVSADVAVTITQPSVVTVTEATGSHVNVTCNGGINGTIVLNTATGGSGSGYQYSKDGGSTWQSGTTFSGLAAATYQMAAKDGNGCVSANVAVTITQPAAVSASIPSTASACSGSSATLSATTTGNSLTYAWRKRGSGWGTGNGWTINNNGTGVFGTVFGDSSINGGSGAGTVGSSGNINSSATTAFGLYASSGGSMDVYRAFGSLAVGQTIQVDIDNGYVSSGGPSVGFGIQNASGQNLWEFYFAGGGSDYTIHSAAGAVDSGIGYTDAGVRITFTLTSSTTYAATIIRSPNASPTTFTFTGTLLTPGSGTQVPGQLHFWNFNAGSGSPYNFYFNNLYVGGVSGTASVALYSDDAANYTSGSWVGGSNLGQGPIASVLSGATEFSGANTATLTINPATSTDAANYDVVVYNTCAAVRSGVCALTVNALPTITLGSSPSVAYGATSANLAYSATANGANKYAITFDATAHTAGFTDVALTTLPSSPIAVTVPAGLSPATFNGILTVENTTTGCTSTNYAFTVTVTKASQTITFGSLTAKTYGDAPFSLTGTANSGLTVSYASDNTSVATVSGSTVTIVGAGTAHLTASQAGNTDYNAAASVIQTLTVNKAGTSVTVGSSANPIHSYGSVSFTATLPADATGSVQFKTNGAALGGAKTLTGGVASSDATSALPRGTQTVTAEYAGDANYLGSTNSLSQVMSDSPPVVNNVSLTRPSNVSLKLKISDLLTNATDVDGDTLVLAAVSASTNGVTVRTNSTYVLYANTNNVADSFTYTVSDGQGGSTTGTVSVSIVAGAAGQSVTINPGGVVTLNFAGVPGYNYVTLRSTNLSAGVGLGWVPISTNTAPGTGLFQVQDDFNDLNGGVPVPTSTPPTSAWYELIGQ
jgi:Bacterial Ig-like domain (group 3)/SprB repeat